MSSKEVNSIIHSLEKDFVREEHAHDFSQSFKEIHQLQEADGGSSSAKFQADMKDLNTRLQANKVLPNLEFMGTDKYDQIFVNGQLKHDNVSRDALVAEDDYSHDAAYGALAISKQTDAGVTTSGDKTIVKNSDGKELDLHFTNGHLDQLRDSNGIWNKTNYGNWVDASDTSKEAPFANVSVDRKTGTIIYLERTPISSTNSSPKTQEK